MGVSHTAPGLLFLRSHGFDPGGVVFAFESHRDGTGLAPVGFHDLAGGAFHPADAGHRSACCLCVFPVYFPRQESDENAESTAVYPAYCGGSGWLQRASWTAGVGEPWTDADSGY